MKKVIASVLASAVLSFGLSATSMAQAAEQKIGIVSVQYVLSKLPQVKAADARINSALSSKKKALEKLENEGEALQKVLSNPSTSEEVRKQKAREMQILDTDYKVKSQEFREEYQKLSAKEMDVIQEKVQKALDTIAKEQGFSAIIRAEAVVSLVDKSIDVSDKVIEVVSKSK